LSQLGSIAPRVSTFSLTTTTNASHKPFNVHSAGQKVALLYFAILSILDL